MICVIHIVVSHATDMNEIVGTKHVEVISLNHVFLHANRAKMRGMLIEREYLKCLLTFNASCPKTSLILYCKCAAFQKLGNKYKKI